MRSSSTMNMACTNKLATTQHKTPGKKLACSASALPTSCCSCPGASEPSLTPCSRSTVSSDAKPTSHCTDTCRPAIQRQPSKRTQASKAVSWLITSAAIPRQAKISSSSGPPENRRRNDACRISANNCWKITKSLVIVLTSTVPADCQLIWLPACSRRASACTLRYN